MLIHLSALISLAAVAASTFSILQMISARYGVGLSTLYVPEGNEETILKVVARSIVFAHYSNL